MRSLLRWTTIVCLTLIACCTAAIAYGRTQRASSDPLRALGFDVCDGKPCFRGVVPGMTTWKAAEARFVNGVNTESSDGTITIPIGSNYVESISFFHDVNSEFITEIETFGEFSSRFIPSEHTLSFGSVIALYGTPCGARLQTYESGSYLLLIYPFLSVQGPVYDDRLTQRSVVTSVSLIPSRYVDFGPCGSKRLQMWHGFGSGKSYAVLQQ